jgi:hypothetical protein
MKHSVSKLTRKPTGKGSRPDLIQEEEQEQEEGEQEETKCGMVRLDVEPSPVASSKSKWPCLFCCSKEAKSEDRERLTIAAVEQDDLIGAFSTAESELDEVLNKVMDSKIKEKGWAVYNDIGAARKKTSDPKDISLLTQCLKNVERLLTTYAIEGSQVRSVAIGDGCESTLGESDLPVRTGRVSLADEQSFKAVVGKAPGNLPRGKQFFAGLSVFGVGAVADTWAIVSFYNRWMESHTYDEIHLGTAETAVEWATVGVGSSVALTGLGVMARACGFFGLFGEQGRGARTGISRKMMELLEAVEGEQQRTYCGCIPRRTGSSKV